jgi:hypothetical protein
MCEADAAGDSSGASALFLLFVMPLRSGMEMICRCEFVVA